MRGAHWGIRDGRSLRALWPALMLAAGGMLGCAQPKASAARSESPVPARQMIVAVDLSGSRDNQELAADKELLETIVQNMRPGDEIVLIRIAGARGQKGLATWARTFPAFQDGHRPTQREQRLFKATQEDATRDVSNLFKQRDSVKIGGTDIRAALFAASDKSREASGRRTTLILLSDMIQEADGLNFTRPRGIPDAEWIIAQKNAELLPSLSNVCVSVVGPDVSTSIGVQTRAFWGAYFRAAGAIFSNDRYRRTMRQFDSLLCPN